MTELSVTFDCGDGSFPWINVSGLRSANLDTHTIGTTTIDFATDFLTTADCVALFAAIGRNDHSAVLDLYLRTRK